MVELFAKWPPARLLGLVCGLLFFMVFVIVVSIAHHNTTDYLPENVPLTEAQQDNILAQYHDDQCEKPKNRASIVERENTLSNVGYAVAGAAICIFGTAWAAQFLGINLLLLSITSGLYHATLTHTPQILDVGSVYAVLLMLSTYVSFAHTRATSPYAAPVWLPIVMGIVIVTVGVVLSLTENTSDKRIHNLIGTVSLPVIVVAINFACYACRRFNGWVVWVVAIVLFAAIPTVGILMRSDFGWDSTVVFILLVLLLPAQLIYLIYTARSCGSLIWWEIGAIVAVLAPAFVLRLTDGYNTSGAPPHLTATRHALCDPDFFIQPHALWHIFSALGLLLAYDLVAQFQRDDDSGRVPTVLFPARKAEID